MRVREASASYIADTASNGMRKSSGMPLLHSLGDRELLHRKWISFFCSVHSPGHLILNAYDLAQRWRAENQSVIGGFHSPVEKEVLKIMLHSTVPVCIVLARSLPKRIPKEFRRPLDEGRLLLASPFDAKTRRATQETAAYRNQVVAALAEKVFVAYAAPGSKTEAFCREVVGTGKPCTAIVILVARAEGRGWIDGGKVAEAAEAKKVSLFFWTHFRRSGMTVCRGDGTGHSGVAAGAGRHRLGAALVSHGTGLESHAAVAGVVPAVELVQRGRAAEGHGLSHLAAEAGTAGPDPFASATAPVAERLAQPPTDRGGSRSESDHG